VAGVTLVMGEVTLRAEDEEVGEPTLDCWPCTKVLPAPLLAEDEEAEAMPTADSWFTVGTALLFGL
jgi:hypothetical protein